uniref:BPTI/Kunitz inhibitor domain-containing protein n=1 Tax=Maylandia zebra TaxID=106582 RepID=A0A3P9D7R1_9CICH
RKTRTRSSLNSLLTTWLVRHSFWLQWLLYLHASKFCQLPADAGQGTSFNFAVYYDVSKDQCSPFLYNGEGGNANRFQTERECLRNCSVNAEDVYPMDGKNHFE